MKKILLSIVLLSLFLARANAGVKYSAMIIDSITGIKNLFVEFETSDTDSTLLEGTCKIYRNDILWIEGSYQANQKFGQWIKYYSDGKICSYTNYAFGEKNGKYLKYGYNSKIFINGSYKNDKKSGKWTYYTPEGKIWSVLNYNNGVLQDTAIGYSKNGSIISWRVYNNGVLVQQKLYDQNSILYTSDSLVDSKMYIQKFYENNSIYAELYHKDSFLIGYKIFKNNAVKKEMQEFSGNGIIRIKSPKNDNSFKISIENNEVVDIDYKNRYLDQISLNPKYIRYIIGRETNTFSFLKYQEYVYRATYKMDSTYSSFRKDFAVQYNLKASLKSKIIKNTLICLSTSDLGDVVDVYSVREIGSRTIINELGDRILSIIASLDYWYPLNRSRLPRDSRIIIPLSVLLE